MSAFLALLYPLSFLIVLSLVVIVHEFGHFWAARLSGVKVEEFKKNMDNNAVNQIANELLMKKLLDFLRQNNSIK